METRRNHRTGRARHARLIASGIVEIARNLLAVTRINRDKAIKHGIVRLSAGAVYPERRAQESRLRFERAIFSQIMRQLLDKLLQRLVNHPSDFIRDSIGSLKS